MKHIGLILKKEDADKFAGVRKIGDIYAVPFAVKPLGDGGLIPIKMQKSEWEKLPFA